MTCCTVLGNSQLEHRLIAWINWPRRIMGITAGLTQSDIPMLELTATFINFMFNLSSPWNHSQLSVWSALKATRCSDLNPVYKCIPFLQTHGTSWQRSQVWKAEAWFSFFSIFPSNSLPFSQYSAWPFTSAPLLAPHPTPPPCSCCFRRRPNLCIVPIQMCQTPIL